MMKNIKNSKIPKDVYKRQDYYNLQWAKDSAERQAGHFFDSRNAQIENLSKHMDTPPIILCPYDAELYGHW